MDSGELGLGIFVITIAILVIGGLAFNIPWRRMMRKRRDKRRLSDGALPHIVYPLLADFRRYEEMDFKHCDATASSQWYYIGIDEDYNLTFTNRNPRHSNWKEKPGRIKRLHVTDFFVDHKIVRGPIIDRQRSEEIKLVEDNLYNEVLDEISKQREESAKLNLDFEYADGTISETTDELRKRVSYTGPGIANY